jgi:hypothetical protein
MIEAYRDVHPTNIHHFRYGWPSGWLFLFSNHLLFAMTKAMVTLRRRGIARKKTQQRCQNIDTILGCQKYKRCDFKELQKGGQLKVTKEAIDERKKLLVAIMRECGESMKKIL